MAEVPDQLKEHAWKPGQSGNPKGRPRRPSFESLVADILDEELEGGDTPMSRRKALAIVFVDAMLKRNTQLIKEYLGREWPVVQQLEFSGRGGGPVEVSGTEEWLAFARSLPVIEEGKKVARGNGSDPTPESGDGSA